MKKVLKNVKVRTKLIAGFIFVALICAAVGFVGVTNIGRLSDLNKTITGSSVAQLMIVSDIREAFQRLRINNLYFVTAQTDAVRGRAINGIHEENTNIDNYLRKLGPLVENTVRRKAAFTEFSTNKKTYTDYIEIIINLAKAKDFRGVERELGTGKAVRLGGVAAVSLEKLNKFIIEETDKLTAFSQSTSQYAQIISMVFATVGVILALILGVGISLAISKPLKNLTVIAKEVKDGNFHTDKSDMVSRNEIGQLAIAFNEVLETLQYKAELLDKVAKGDLSVSVQKSSDKDMLGQSLYEMVDSLNMLLQEVSAAIQQVASGSAQISSTSQDLSGGASEQASSIEEISATIEEINSQAKLNAENTTQSSQIARSTLDIAAKGNEKMNSLLEAMLKIDESAGRIKKIVKFIDDIAFQINLLALNANVEAARAGKYGKGFAVVADEVRNLAVKSAGSVKETESMVEETIKNISVVKALVDDSASIFAEISNGAAKTAELLEEVALATNEQANGLEEISKGIIQIDSVTQSNTASAEETAASSEELSGQAEQLKILIERFKLRRSRALPSPENNNFTELSSEQVKPVKLDAKKDNQDKKSKNFNEKITSKPSSVITLDDDHEIF